jgi:hypothetical protein
MSNASKTSKPTEPPSSNVDGSRDADANLLRERTQRFIDIQTDKTLKSGANHARHLADQRAKMPLVTTTTSVGKGKIQRCSAKAAREDLHRAWKVWKEDRTMPGTSTNDILNPERAETSATAVSTTLANTPNSTMTGATAG